MSNLSKECLIGWWVLVLVAFLLWYRNVKHDRVMAPILVMLGTLQLVNYACHSQLHPMVAGKIVIILITIMLFIIALCLQLSTKSPLATVMIVISVVYFILVMVDIVVSKTVYTAVVTQPGTTPQWNRAGGDILGGCGGLITIFIMVAWIILMCYSEYVVELLIIGGFVLLAVAIACRGEDVGGYGPNLVHYLSGLALVVWLVGYIR